MFVILVWADSDGLVRLLLNDLSFWGRLIIKLSRGEVGTRLVLTAVSAALPALNQPIIQITHPASQQPSRQLIRAAMEPPPLSLSTVLRLAHQTSLALLLFQLC